MHVTKVLKKDKSERYYKARYLQAGAMATLDRVLFDAKYLETLLPNELLAVGAHEFTHLNQRHGIKKFWRSILPAIVTGVAIGLLVYFNFASIDRLSFFSSLGKSLSSLFLGVSFWFGALMACLYVNAKWLRQQETNCDLSSVKFLNSEDMISALIKLDQLRPHKTGRFAARLLPRLYPTLEQRIKDIRKAMDDKKNREGALQKC
jgi:Zn-dependent protease with chaperone function